MQDLRQLRIIDSHVHFWRVNAPGHRWPDLSLPLLYRDFGPADLLAATASEPLESVVLVQSQPDERDTDWLLEVAAQTPLVGAVVGWVDLASPEAPARIAQLAAFPKMRGLRPMLADIEDTHWLLRPEIEPALLAMAQHGMRLEFLIQPRHLTVVAEFAQRWPRLPVVIDHGAKPHIARDEIQPWRAEIAALRNLPNVYCKLSGLRTEQVQGAPVGQLKPYVRHLLDTFSDRLMWGSDWPVLLHSGDRYLEWLAQTRLLTGLPEQEMETLMRAAAAQFYGLK